METINLNQLTAGESGIYLLAEAHFSGFAIETFADGSLATQMSLKRGMHDGVTRRWHPDGQLASEKSFRNGAEHGWHREWNPDSVLAVQSQWKAGECSHMRKWDEQARLIYEMWRDGPASMARSQYFEMRDDGSWVEIKTDEGKEPA